MDKNTEVQIGMSQEDAILWNDYQNNNALSQLAADEKKRKNSKERFVMVEQTALWRLTQQFTTIYEYQFLNYLMEKMNQTNAVMVSQKTLMKVLGAGRTSVHRTIQKLEHLQVIKIVKIGTANCYIINSDIAWKKNRESKEKFSIFNATLIADWDEQTIEYKSNWDTKLQPVPRPFIKEQQSINELGEE